MASDCFSEIEAYMQLYYLQSKYYSQLSEKNLG